MNPKRLPLHWSSTEALELILDEVMVFLEKFDETNEEFVNELTEFFKKLNDERHHSFDIFIKPDCSEASVCNHGVVNYFKFSYEKFICLSCILSLLSNDFVLYNENPESFHIVHTFKSGTSVTLSGSKY
jgi:hypothetical protein